MKIERRDLKKKLQQVAITDPKLIHLADNGICGICGLSHA